MNIERRAALSDYTDAIVRLRRIVRDLDTTVDYSHTVRLVNEANQALQVLMSTSEYLSRPLGEQSR
jgi:hypothetical protein